MILEQLPSGPHLGPLANSWPRHDAMPSQDQGHAESLAAHFVWAQQVNLASTVLRRK